MSYNGFMKSVGICSCEIKHDLKYVVITGGPGAGKTAALELAKKHFCSHVKVLPEAASILFGGGFIRSNTLSAKRASQRAIYRIQSELERIILEEGGAAVALCDRGSIDGLAYWPGDEKEFWLELNTSKEIEYQKYSCVIHLRTPTQEHGYNYENPVRIESAQEAALIDARISEVWKDHPRVIEIESTEDFLGKVSQVLTILRQEIPACCRP